MRGRWSLARERWERRRERERRTAGERGKEKDETTNMSSSLASSPPPSLVDVLKEDFFVEQIVPGAFISKKKISIPSLRGRRRNLCAAGTRTADGAPLADTDLVDLDLSRFYRLQIPDKRSGRMIRPEDSSQSPLAAKLTPVALAPARDSPFARGDEADIVCGGTRPRRTSRPSSPDVVGAGEEPPSTTQPTLLPDSSPIYPDFSFCSPASYAGVGQGRPPGFSEIFHAAVDHVQRRGPEELGMDLFLRHWHQLGRFFVDEKSAFCREGLGGDAWQDSGEGLLQENHASLRLPLGTAFSKREAKIVVEEFSEWSSSTEEEDPSSSVEEEDDVGGANVAPSWRSFPTQEDSMMSTSTMFSVSPRGGHRRSPLRRPGDDDADGVQKIPVEGLERDDQGDILIFAEHAITPGQRWLSAEVVLRKILGAGKMILAPGRRAFDTVVSLVFEKVFANLVGIGSILPDRFFAGGDLSPVLLSEVLDVVAFVKVLYGRVDVFLGDEDGDEEGSLNGAEGGAGGVVGQQGSGSKNATIVECPVRRAELTRREHADLAESVHAFLGMDAEVSIELPSEGGDSDDGDKARTHKTPAFLPFSPRKLFGFLGGHSKFAAPPRLRPSELRALENAVKHARPAFAIPPTSQKRMLKNKNAVGTTTLGAYIENHVVGANSDPAPVYDTFFLKQRDPLHGVLLKTGEMQFRRAVEEQADSAFEKSIRLNALRILAFGEHEGLLNEVRASLDYATNSDGRVVEGGTHSEDLLRTRRSTSTSPNEELDPRPGYFKAFVLNKKACRPKKDEASDVWPQPESPATAEYAEKGRLSYGKRYVALSNLLQKNGLDNLQTVLFRRKSDGAVRLVPDGAAGWDGPSQGGDEQHHGSWEVMPFLSSSDAELQAEEHSSTTCGTASCGSRKMEEGGSTAPGTTATSESGTRTACTDLVSWERDLLTDLISGYTNAQLFAPLTDCYGNTDVRQPFYENAAGVAALLASFLHAWAENHAAKTRPKNFDSVGEQQETGGVLSGPPDLRTLFQTFFQVQHRN